MDDATRPYEPPELNDMGTIEAVTGADLPGSGDGGNQDPAGAILDPS